MKIKRNDTVKINSKSVGGTGGYILKPYNMSPADGATNVSDQPTFQMSTFLPDYCGVTHEETEILIANDASFTDIIIFNLAPSLSTYVPDAFVLPDESVIYWKYRYKDILGNWSDWSDATSFTTANYTFVTEPTIASPTEGEVLNTLTPTLTSSAFVVAGGTDTHISSSWEITDDVETLVWQITSDTDLESIVVDEGLLVDGSTYRCRVLHTGENEGDSTWSAYVSFTITLL